MKRTALANLVLSMMHYEIWEYCHTTSKVQALSTTESQSVMGLHLTNLFLCCMLHCARSTACLTMQYLWHLLERVQVLEAFI